MDNRHTRTRTVQRSATPATVDGMLITAVTDPRFISLVGSPANQRAFSVIRDDGTGTKSVPANRKTRTKRNDANHIAQMVFPVTYTDEQVAENMEKFGLVGYDVERSDEAVTARRSDLKSISNDDVSSIKLTEDGVVAQILRADAPKTENGKSNIAVTSLTFSSETFSRSDAKAWLEENQVDFDEKALDNSTGNFVLQRSDVEGEEVRQIELAEGVVANVVRSDVLDVPEGFVVVISEAAYGGWGWGHLDFDARLADVEVSEKIREGLYMLDDILRDILFYSALPIDSRKELAQRSLQQFGEYAGNLLDQLPRQLLLQVGGAQRSDKQQEQQTMTVTASTTTEKKDTDVLSITRGDLNTMIADALAAHTSAQRSDATTPAAAPATTETAPAATTPAAPAAATLTREDIMGAVAEAMKPLAERLEKVEGVTVLRSDGGDPVVPAAEPAAEQSGKALSEEQKTIQRQDSVFAGVLGLGGRKK